MDLPLRHFFFTVTLFIVLIFGSGCKTSSKHRPQHYAKATQPLTYDAKVQLRGRIVPERFPGPPEYQDINKGDQEEVYWILHMDRAFEVAAIPQNEMNPAEKNLTRVQLVFSEANSYQRYRNLVNQVVVVDGRLIHQVTVHHKTAVLIEVKKIERGRE